jgi:hypothetical protein
MRPGRQTGALFSRHIGEHENATDQLNPADSAIAAHRAAILSKLFKEHLYDRARQAADRTSESAYVDAVRPSA